MKKIALLLAFIAGTTALALDFGTSNQVYVVPNAGGRGQFGQVDLSQSAAVKNQLPASKGGFGIDTSASTGVPSVSAGSWVVASTLSKVLGGTGQSNASLTFPSTGTVQATTPNNHGLMVSGAGATATVIAPDASTTKVLVSGGASADPGWASSIEQSLLPFQQNYVLNSSLFLWQATTSITIANTVSSYGPDQFYGKNSLGPVGVLTLSQQAAGLNGSHFAAKLLISTAPTSAQTNGTELYYILDNPDSMAIYNKTASGGVQVKAFGNVNQVGIQFYYATSEVKLTTSVGSEGTCTVNTSSYVQCSTLGQALGTSMTTSGVIGMRIRITGVSSGNTYDLNNGFQIEQLQINTGSTLAPWAMRSRSMGEEVAAAQRYYEKSYPITQAVASSTDLGCASWAQSSAVGNGSFLHIAPRFIVEKRASPTVTLYDNVGGTPKVDIGGVSTTAATANVSTRSFSITNNSGGSVGAAGTVDEAHWTADARL